jgi:hypothetical protein
MKPRHGSELLSYKPHQAEPAGLSESDSLNLSDHHSGGLNFCFFHGDPDKGDLSYRY